jgi:hypothetical protein
MFAFLAAHRCEVFPDELFADLFAAGKGRPSIPAEVVASVIVLQTLHGLSDEAAAEAVTFDLRWKAACGLAITAKGLHPTTLTYWRRRLGASERPNRVFDAVKVVVAQTGVLAGRTRRALDSTVLDDAVATQDTVTQLIAAIRRVARVVPGAAEVVAVVCTAHDYADPGKPRIAWDDAPVAAGDQPGPELPAARSLHDLDLDLDLEPMRVTHERVDQHNAPKIQSFRRSTASTGPSRFRRCG